MTTEQREIFRRAVLNVYEANDTRFGLGATSVQVFLGMFGFPGAAIREIEEAIEYLEGKGLVAKGEKRISAENRVWRITAEGRALIDQ